jgi:hypothetical protein
MKVKMATLLLLVFPLLAFSGGVVVDNGGGLAETNFVFVLQNLPGLIDRCIDVDNPCKLTTLESRILASEARGLPQNMPKLIFKSGSQNPGLFEVDEHGKTRVAVTGHAPGDPIYLNLDLLYKGGRENEPAIDSTTAIAILIHELGHQYGEPDHLTLDILGNKVKSFRLGFIESLNLRRFGQEKFSITAHNNSAGMNIQRGLGPFPPTPMTWENGYELVDITAAVVAVAKCADGVTVARSRYFSGFTWNKVAAVDVARKRQTLSFSFDAEVECNSATARAIESYRVQWSAEFLIKEYVNGAGLIESAYPNMWQFDPKLYLSLDPASVQVSVH